MGEGSPIGVGGPLTNRAGEKKGVSGEALKIFYVEKTSREYGESNWSRGGRLKRILTRGKKKRRCPSAKVPCQGEVYGEGGR